MQYIFALGDLVDRPPKGIAHHPAGTWQATAFVRACTSLRQFEKENPTRRPAAWQVLLAKLANDAFFVGKWNKLPGQPPPCRRTPELLAEFSATVAPALREYSRLVPTNPAVPKNLLAVASHYRDRKSYPGLLTQLARALAPGRAAPPPENVDLSDQDAYDDDFDDVRKWQKEQGPQGGTPNGRCSSIAIAVLCATLLAAGSFEISPQRNGSLLLNSTSFNGDLLIEA